MSLGRVLLIASFADSVAKFRGSLIASLLEAGANVDVAIPSNSDVHAVRVELKMSSVGIYEIPISRTGLNPLSDFRLLVSLYRLMRETRPSVLIPYTVKPVVYGTIAGWLAGVPRRYALVTGLGYAFTGKRKSLLAALVRRLYRFALARAHKVFFQNPDDERLFRELELLPRRVPSVVVNGSGVDLSLYPESPVPRDSTVFLMIGRLLGDKGVREYARAARRVKALYPHAKFRLIGWIDSNPDAIESVELDEWTSGGTLDFLGRLSDVRSAIADSTVYVLPSYREGTPRTVLEAMAMGRPVITTDAPGCRETVVDGDNGFLIPVQSVEALVAAMLRFIEDPALAVRMGRRSREIAEEKYDVHKVNTVILREMGIVPAAGEGGKHVA